MASFEPWGWVIGIGVYTKEIYDLIEDEKIKLLKAILIFTAPILFLAYCVSRFFSAVIHEMSSRDALTGVFSRQFFNEHLQKIETQSQDEKEDHLFFLFGDIDHFKEINDKYGHAEGDKVLAKVGALLLAKSRGHDIVYRYGGEEFVIVLSAPNKQAAFELAERLRQAVVKQIKVKNEPVSMSFGLAKYAPAHPVSHSVERADATLYHAKSAGRNVTKCDWDLDPA